MAKSLPTVPQSYPRIEDSKDKNYGCLDDTKLVPHSTPRRITPDLLRSLIIGAVARANIKSSRESLSLPPDATEEELDTIYRREARALFTYFHDYPSDPAATAHEYHGKHYRAVGNELVRIRAIQKGRMNSGWRYQFLAAD